MNTLPGNQPEFDSSNVKELEGSILKGKRVIFLGSSVTFGYASLEDGIPEYFAKRFNCKITKEAVSGTTLADLDETSYVSRLKANVDVNIHYDLLICQLSTNDATKGIELGKISDSHDIESFDTKTITGAMEYIIGYAKKNWNCPVFFYTGSRYDSPNYEKMVARLFELKDKWGVGVLDLWSDDEFNNISDELRALYMKDPIHPTKAGYMKWWCPEIEKQLLASDEFYKQRAEESLRKKFHKQIFSPFAKACKTYKLIEEGDKIAVCISGGKDSMLMAKCFQEIKKHRQVNFDLTFIVMDPGYNEENRKLIEYNARRLGIPVNIFESDIFDAVDTIEKNPCYLCARMRRGYLYSKARELGCNKIALGHHYDDVIETILMGMLYGGQVQTMMPKLHSTNFEGMELIRPLYLVREEDILKWRDYNELRFLQCACHFTETCSNVDENGVSASMRLETKKLIASLKDINPFVEANIFKSVENVNLSTVIAYKKDGVKHHFLDEY